MKHFRLYRQHQPPASHTIGELMAMATGPDNNKLLRLAMQTPPRPVLVGFGGGDAVVKRASEPDSGDSFESLYDSCITLSDLRKMQHHHVDRPEDIPPDTVYVHTVVKGEISMDAMVAVRVRDTADARGTVRTLFEENQDFRDSLQVLIGEAFNEPAAEIIIRYTVIGQQAAQYGERHRMLDPTTPWKLSWIDPESADPNETG